MLDDDATRYAGELVRQAPRVIADAQDFAIPPFERTYIEFNFRTWFRAITGRDPDADGDDRVAYLIVKNRIRMLSYRKGMPIGIYPMEYELWNPFTLAEELALAQKLQTSRMAFDVFFWGESALQFMSGKWDQVHNHHFDVDGVEPFVPEIRDISGGTQGIPIPGAEKIHSVSADAETAAAKVWDREGLRAIRANHRFTFYDPRMATPQMWRVLVGGACGELRNVIAMLLFLNRTKKLHYEREEPTVTRMWKTRPIPLLKHRTITLHVNPVPRLVKLAAGEGIRRRLHDVRGHFCHNEVARSNACEHVWAESREDHLQWRCECGGLRWWKREHQRGHADKGIVTADYKVKE